MKSIQCISSYVSTNQPNHQLTGRHKAAITDKKVSDSLFDKGVKNAFRSFKHLNGLNFSSTEANKPFSKSAI